MRIHRWLGALASTFALALSAVAVPAAHAGIVDFILSNCGQAGLSPGCNNTDSGFSTLKFSSGGLDLTANGTVLGSPNNFDLVDLGVADETGLGLFGQAHNEVNVGDNIQLDMTDLVKAGITSGSITLSSLQTGEVGFVQFDATGQAVVQVDSTGVSAPVPVTFSLADPFVNITANSGDVLAVGDVEVSVPEPGTIALLFTGLVGVLLFAMTRKRYRLA